MLITLALLSGVGGFFSGFLGVGGAVVLIPLMLSVPPLLGVGQLTMHEVAGLTMVQVLVASFFAFRIHQRSGFIHRKTTLAIGLPMGACALLGSGLSKYMPSAYMLMVFGVLVALALVLLLKKTPNESGQGSDAFTFHLAGSILTGALVGFAAGIVGAGGGFVVIPVMVRLLNIPMRIAVGSSLGIVFIGALMGSVGKAITLQIEWLYLIPVIAGSLPASLWGAHVSKKMPPAYVRYALIAVVALVLINTWRTILIHP